MNDVSGKNHHKWVYKFYAELEHTKTPIEQTMERFI